MAHEAVEQILREYMRRRPFQPFVIELASGERIEVDAPQSVAWGGDAAGYLQPDGEAIFFRLQDIRQILAPTAETMS